MKNGSNEKYMILGGNGVGDGEFELVADEMIRMTGKKSPYFLYVGFAQIEPHHGFEYYGVLFASKGCACALLTNEDVNDSALAAAKIAAADIIFIAGGQTHKLLETIRAGGVDRMLASAAARGAVMSGISAGAITLCESGVSKKNGRFLIESGIGCLDLFCCPHPFDENFRFRYFREKLADMPGVKGLACDGAAFEVFEGKYRALIFCPDGHFEKICEYKNTGYSETEISGEFRSLADLNGM